MTWASARMSHLSASDTVPVTTMSGCSGALADTGPDEGERQVRGVPRLVLGEVVGQHAAALVLVHPAQVAEVGPVAEAEDVAPASAGPGRVVDAEAQDDLGSGPDAVDVLHEVPLGPGVVHEPVDVAEAAPEGREVEGGLVVGGGVEHHRDLGHGDGVDRGGEQVGVAGDHVGVRRGHRVDQVRAHRPVEGDPLPGLGQRGHLGGHPQLPVEREVVERPGRRGREPADGHPVDAGWCRRARCSPT